MRAWVCKSNPRFLTDPMWSFVVWSKCKNKQWDGYKSSSHSIVVFVALSVLWSGMEYIIIPYFRGIHRINHHELGDGKKKSKTSLDDVNKTHKIIILMTNKYSEIIVLWSNDSLLALPLDDGHLFLLLSNYSSSSGFFPWISPIDRRSLLIMSTTDSPEDEKQTETETDFVIIIHTQDKIGSLEKRSPITRRKGSQSRDRLKTWLIRTGNDRSSDPMNRNSFFLSLTNSLLSGRMIDAVGIILCDFDYEEDRLIKITVGATLHWSALPFQLCLLFRDPSKSMVFPFVSAKWMMFRQ